MLQLIVGILTVHAFISYPIELLRYHRPGRCHPVTQVQPVAFLWVSPE